MNFDYMQSRFSKALLTGVFAGIVTSIICLFYNLIYRDTTRFLPADYINVPSLIFAINLIFLVIGIIYFTFLKAFKKGQVIFITLFLLLTLFCIWQTAVGHRFINYELNAQFKGLLLGIIVIMGIGASFLLPFLFHNKKFAQRIL